MQMHLQRSRGPDAAGQIAYYLTEARRRQLTSVPMKASQQIGEAELGDVEVDAADCRGAGQCVCAPLSWRLGCLHTSRIAAGQRRCESNALSSAEGEQNRVRLSGNNPGAVFRL